jgi:hypothetical protein
MWDRGIIFLVLVFGWFLGYTHCYNALNNKYSDYIDRNECTFDDIPIKTVMLNKKIPAKILDIKVDLIK